MRTHAERVSSKAPSLRSTKPSTIAAPSAERSPWHASHQALGNQGVQRLLRAGVIQAKLQVSQPNDPYEQEADRVADAVMRTGSPAQAKKSSCPACATGAAPCPKCAADENPVVQRKDIATDVRSSAPSTPDNLLPTPARGRLLDPETRAFFELRFGYDLSRVRVHTDSEAVRKSRALNAQAFTLHRDIYFGAGKSPGRDALTAHELTHVLQQTGGRRLNEAQQRQPLTKERAGKRESSGVANSIATAPLQARQLYAPSIQRVVEMRPPG